MTRDDIIRMAREAREQTMKELPPNTFDLDLFHERFAALVAAQERKAAEERVTDLFADMETPYLPDIINAIRARGQNE
jgi:sirohydrochlorin ferrochelatase